MSSGDVVTLVVAVIYGSANVAAAFIAATKASQARSFAEAAHDSIGPTDGETVKQMLNEVRNLHQYTERRNHDIIDLAFWNGLCLHSIAKKLGIELPTRPNVRQRLQED